MYHTLRDAIMRCDLRPGERLIIDDLARRLEVSIIPVREALQLLQSEVLVVNVPHVGATVALLSRESIIDVFTVLEGLETVATRLAAERAGRDRPGRSRGAGHQPWTRRSRRRATATGPTSTRGSIWSSAPCPGSICCGT